jgi:hypothetical protein
MDLIMREHTSLPDRGGPLLLVQIKLLKGVRQVRCGSTWGGFARTGRGGQTRTCVKKPTTGRQVVFIRVEA